MQNTNKIEMPDFNKSFKFKNIDIVYQWDAVLQKVVTNKIYVLENITQSTVKNYIGEGIWKIVQDDLTPLAQMYKAHAEQSPAPTLLDTIKSFTTLSGSSIFIQPDGEYEVYYDGSDTPAKAKSDEEMKKLIEAIAVLHVATYGE